MIHGALIKIHNLDVLSQKFLALFLSAIISIIVLYIIIISYRSIYDKTNELYMLRVEAGELLYLAAKRDRLASEIEMLKLKDGNFVGTEDEVMRRLLEEIEVIMEASGAFVLSAGGAPDVTVGDIVNVSVRVVFTGDFESVHAAVRSLEVSAPRLYLREATIQSTTDWVNDRVGEGELTVQALVVSPMSATGLSGRGS